jgi:hypothetical protein
MADESMADIIAEMSGKQTERMLREQKKAQRDARQEQIDADAEIAKRSAIAVLDEKDARDRRWYATHLGRLSSQQYRDYCQQEYGFDPGV